MSPPRRASVSPMRRTSVSRRAISTRSSSPASTPRLSFTVWKRSRSRWSTAIDSRRPARAAHEREREPVEEQGLVRQARQAVVGSLDQEPVLGHLEGRHVGERAADELELRAARAPRHRTQRQLPERWIMRTSTSSSACFPAIRAASPRLRAEVVGWTRRNHSSARSGSSPSEQPRISSQRGENQNLAAPDVPVPQAVAGPGPGGEQALLGRRRGRGEGDGFAHGRGTEKEELPDGAGARQGARSWGVRTGTRRRARRLSREGFTEADPRPMDPGSESMAGMEGSRRASAAIDQHPRRHHETSRAASPSR